MSADDEGRWSEPDVVARFRTEGYSDAGEAAVLDAVAAWAAGAVLDVGVGGGRTTGLLAPAARRYVGVDVSARMVELARTRWPGVDLRTGDVRRLDEVDGVDGDHDLVVFSFNGLDALDHAGRVAALAELARVVAPGGRVVLSSLNRDGVSFDESPFTMRDHTPYGLALDLARMVYHLPRTITGVRNYRRTRRASVDGPTWALRPMRAHEFRFVVYFATVGATVRLLGEAGLEVSRAWSDDGSEIDVATEHHTADWVHYLCRRTPQPG